MAPGAVNHGEGLRQPKTSSRCVVETAEHNFEITSYTLLEGMGVGKFISSSTFSAGGHDWYIRFYPDGDRKETAGYASAFLMCLSMPAKDGVRAKFTLAMLDGQGNAQEEDKDYVVVHIFNSESTGHGFPKFVEKSNLKSSPQLHSGCLLTIRCVLVVIKEPSTECNTNLIVVPTPKLSGQLECALGSGKGVDVTLLVGGMEFRAHRFMLAARSPVFNAQLFGPMMAKDTCHIEVDDMEPSIFEMLLHFIYTDSLSPCNDKEEHDVATMQHLLVAADRYGLVGLKVMCEDKLFKSINVETVKTTLAIANKHYCGRLEKACEDFLSKPGVAAAVLLSEGFKSLIARFPLLVLEKDQKDKEGGCQEEEVRQ